MQKECEYFNACPLANLRCRLARPLTHKRLESFISHTFWICVYVIFILHNCLRSAVIVQDYLLCKKYLRYIHIIDNRWSDLGHRDRKCHRHFVKKAVEKQSLNFKLNALPMSIPSVGRRVKLQEQPIDR